MPARASDRNGTITVAGATSYQMQVTYSDDTAINVGNLDNSDIRITGPGGFNVLAQFVSVDVNTNGTDRKSVV